jgi:hypothetical protein
MQNMLGQLAAFNMINDVTDSVTLAIRASVPEGQHPTHALLDAVRSLEEKRAGMTLEVNALADDVMQAKRQRAATEVNSVRMPMQPLEGHDQGWVLDSEALRAEVPPYQPHFHGENGLGSWYDTWNNLVIHGETQRYVEADYKKALGILLKGDALRTFNSIKAWPQSEMVQMLSDHYLEPEKTLDENVQEMEIFSRRLGESIRACMARYRVLVTATRDDVGAEARHGRAVVMMEDALKALCSPTARELIKQKQLLGRTEGYNTTFLDFLQIAERQEKRERGFPIRSVPLKAEVREKTATKSSTQDRTVRTSTLSDWQDRTGRTSSLSDWWAWLKRAWRRRPHLILRRQAEQDRVWARMVDNVRQETRARAMPKAGESR